ncbi:MAG: C/D box methylation guide ribonucleoprotein complex aNOP56 subunit [Candidatus Methanomethylicia archaeon]
MMEAYLLIHDLGYVAANINGEVISTLIDRDISKLVQQMKLLTEEKIPDDLKQFCSNLVSIGIRRIYIENESFKRALASTGIEVEVNPKNTIFRILKKTIINEAIKIGLVRNIEEYYNLIRCIQIELVKIQLRETAAKRDLMIANAVKALDDINKIINLNINRIREWYSIHFPELSDIVEDHEVYLNIVSRKLSRVNINRDDLVKIGVPTKLVELIVSSAKKSIGAEITDIDLEAVGKLAEKTLDLIAYRNDLSNYIDKTVGEIAPNMKCLVGGAITARLISIAGGLEKLAESPASRVQVLGAEKALFRFLRSKTKPPKHGVIFGHPELRSAPRWQRGKIARALASKLAIAARIDYFGGEFIGEQLKAELEERIKQIRETYTKPPKREEVKKLKRKK